MARPWFVGEDWLFPSRGFSYEKPPSASDFDQLLSDDEWLSLLSAFEKLRKGDFSCDTDLFELAARTSDSEIRESALCLLGHAGRTECRTRLATFFGHAERDTRMSAYDAALYSGDLLLVDPLLAACVSARGDERITIMSRISHLLEPEPDLLYDDQGAMSMDDYVRLVRAARESCLVQCGQPGPVLEGRPLSLDYVIDRIETLCGGGEAYEFSGTIAMYVQMFEAMSGQSSVGVFDAEVAVDPVAALAMIGEFHRHRGRPTFPAGHRYFFGHRVPL